MTMTLQTRAGRNTLYRVRAAAISSDKQRDRNRVTVSLRFIATNNGKTTTYPFSMAFIYLRHLSGAL